MWLPLAILLHSIILENFPRWFLLLVQAAAPARVGWFAFCIYCYSLCLCFTWSARPCLGLILASACMSLLFFRLPVYVVHFLWVDPKLFLRCSADIGFTAHYTQHFFSCLFGGIIIWSFSRCFTFYFVEWIFLNVYKCWVLFADTVSLLRMYLNVWNNHFKVYLMGIKHHLFYSCFRKLILL